MSNLARAVELVEKAAEEDAQAGRPPEFRVVLNDALIKAYPRQYRAYAIEHPGAASRDRASHDDREMLALRYGLFYAAKMAYPDEAPDLAVRRWRGID
jgi:hypothetical protein